ncbi:hypothetical protein B0H15DRAFT_365487 [Mycena belliarum]|uniref:Uncharacterized protein n=1 Tax=Mycena belliarum TaxID=1033014 RepID=A0AAD6XKW8_9AGAR|nr:hypothetical protein B0H15DRAFT_365487 [Mycena belliae]
MTLQPFDAAADQILELIDAERVDACTALHERLRQLDAQFAAFRKTARETNAQLETALRGLQHTLNQAGIYCSPGRLSFGPQWGAVVRGLASAAPQSAPPVLVPREVVLALEAQRQEVGRWRSRELDQIKRALPALQPEPYYTNHSPLLPSPTIDCRVKASLKRRAGIANDWQAGNAAKRSRGSMPVTANSETIFFNPGFNPPRPVVSQLAQPLVNINAHRLTLSPHLYAPRRDLSAPPLKFLSPASVPATARHSEPANICHETLPILEHWHSTLVPSAEPPAATSLPSILPPLSALAGAHACSFYMWFAIRAFLFRKLSSADAAGAHTPTTARTPADWAVKLHNLPGPVNYVYNEAAPRCACGLPPLDGAIMRSLAEGAAFAPRDFAARGLQVLLRADLALANAQPQLDAADAALLGAQRAREPERARLRRGVFRDGWGAAFVPAPLEEPRVGVRRAWIARFRDVLRDWPGFEVATAPAMEGEGSTDAEWLAHEQCLIGFYLRTLSETLGVQPVRPLQRPDAGQLPEAHRHLFAEIQDVRGV